MMTGFNINDPGQLLALLLHFGGEDLYDIFETIPAQRRAAVEAGGGNPAQDVFVRGVGALTEYFTPQQNTEYQRYEFRQCKQGDGESLEKFVGRLRPLAATCEFHDQDAEIKSQIIASSLHKN
jgi:hypothetical protein